MYYISSMKDGKYGITDTKDNVEEFYTEQEVLSLSNKFKIYGVSGKAIYPIEVKALQCKLAGFGFEYSIDEDDIVLTNYTGTANDVAIPDFITRIGNEAFKESSITSIAIPDSVTSIGDDAFWNCVGLTTITIPDSVTSIGVSAFDLCTSLTSVTIPNSVTSIEDFTFSDCFCLTSVTIPSSVTTIGNEAFSGSGLTSITIPASVTLIDNDAFFSCHSLTSITILDGVTSIGIETFSYCDKLVSISIPSSVTIINDGAFYDCVSLTTINYSGTIEQFRSLVADPSDIDLYNDIVINCSDGDLQVSNGRYTN